MTEKVMRILVLDDNPDDRALEVREVYALFPSAKVIELLDATGFETALAEAAPDLVVTDLDLRWTTGREVLLAVKARHPACPVVMFTGTGDETIAVDLMKLGLDDYVVKSPRQLPRLRVSLKIAVEMARSRSELSDREARLSRALAQQQMVVRELHHRVKNNLQTITSLLNLRVGTVDPATKAHLVEMAGRMEALGSVQARIYQSSDFDKVDFNATLSDIATSVIEIYRGNQVSLDFSNEGSFTLDLPRAVPLSLACYEVLLNAMKHAFPPGRSGTLSIAITEKAGTHDISISDDGVGFDTDGAAQGMGSRIVRTMADEAGATYTLVSAPGQGTRVSLRLQ